MLSAVLFVSAAASTASAQPHGRPGFFGDRTTRMAKQLQADYDSERSAYEKSVREFDQKALRLLTDELRETRKELDELGRRDRRNADILKGKIDRLEALRARYERESGKVTPQALDSKQKIIRELVALVQS